MTRRLGLATVDLIWSLCLHALQRCERRCKSCVLHQ